MNRLKIILGVCALIPCLVFGAGMGIEPTGTNVLLAGPFDLGTNVVTFGGESRTNWPSTNGVNARVDGLTNGATLGATAIQPAATNGWVVSSHASLLTTNGNAIGLTNFPASVVLTNNAKLLAAITNETYLGTLTNVVVNNVTGTVASGVATLTITAGAGDFKADGSVAMSGNLNGGGQLATNFVNLVLTNNAGLLTVAEKAIATNAYPNANGIASSNLAYTASTNAEAARVIATNAQQVASNALPKSSTNALDIQALQIRGGSPTNTALLVPTNSEGQLGYVVYPKIIASKSSAQGFATSGALVSYPTVVYQLGGTWDGTNWTPGVVGLITINARIQISGNTAGMFYYFKLNLNNVSRQSGPQWTPSNEAYPVPAVTFCDYNNNVTNVWSVTLVPEHAKTNTADATFNQFSGSISP